ncbi:MAG: NUDIX domain-containing protein [Patescibacteria group bacterium]
MSDPKRTQSVGGVILNPEKQVLVVSQHGTAWSLPKGHLENGEDEISALYREIHEETGLEKKDLTLHKKLGTYERWRIGEDGRDDHSEWKTITMYFLTTRVTELKPIDSENPEARWVDQDDVEILLTHPSDKEFFESIRDHLSLRLDVSVKLVFLRSFVTIFEAETVKQLLEAEGIKVIFQTMQPNSAAYLGNITGGELYVRSEDIERAREILQE